LFRQPLHIHRQLATDTLRIRNLHSHLVHYAKIADMLKDAIPLGTHSTQLNSTRLGYGLQLDYRNTKQQQQQQQQ